MKNINRTSRKTISLLITSIVILLLALGSGAVWVYMTKNNNEVGESAASTTKNTGFVSSDPATSDQLSAGNNIKQESITAEKPPIPENITGEITAANQADGTLYIRAIINDTTVSGTCTLNMSNASGKKYVATADVQAMPSSTTCKGFNVPINSLTQEEWMIKITYTNGDKKLTMEKKVLIQ